MMKSYKNPIAFEKSLLLITDKNYGLEMLQLSERFIFKKITLIVSEFGSREIIIIQNE